MQISKHKTMAIVIALVLVCSMAISIGAVSTVKGDAFHLYPIPNTITAANPHGDGYDNYTYGLIQAGLNWAGMDQNITGSAAQGQTTTEGIPTRTLNFQRFHDQIPTHVFIITAPNPIGIGQSDNIVMFNPQLPPSALATNLIRYDYTFQVTTPNGTVENYPTSTPPAYSSWSQNSIQTVNGQLVFQSDSTGSTYMSYTPDTVGNYTFTVNFLPFTYMWNSTNQGGSPDYYGVKFLASSYTTTLVVQQNPVSLTGLTAPSYNPVPTQFWTRPINQQNVEWYAIASNWLENGHDLNNGGQQNAYQPDGTAPMSGHILWTRPEEDSGILGGSNTGRIANSFNTGSQYQPRFTQPTYGGEGPIIMYGRVYYSPSLYSTGYSELYNCLDLKTGQFLYQVNTTAVTGARNLPQFGYYYDQDDVNEHGIQNPGWLFTTGYTVGYQPEYGYPELHLLNVPSGVEIQGPSGEGLRYQLFSNATNYYMAEWNSSKVIPTISSGSAPSTLPYQANVPITPSQPAGTYWNGTTWAPNPNLLYASGVSSFATIPASYDFNVTLTYQGSPVHFATAPTVGAASVNNFVWGYNATWPTGTGAPSYAYPDNVTVWAININGLNQQSTTAPLLYMTTITTDVNPTSADSFTGNQNLLFEHADPNADVFIAMEVPSQTFFVWNMTTGALMFQTDAQSATISPYGYYTWPSLISGTQVKTAYGMLFTGGYSGSISAYSLVTGQLVWRYAVIPPGTAGVIKSSPGMMTLIAGGNLYVGVHEHSAETPLEAGNQMKCLNATTTNPNGQLEWALNSWVYPSAAAVADGIMVYFNNYDGQFYALGQGPTQTIVNAPGDSTQLGGSLVISGSVYDVSAGSQQTTVKANFPNGVPAVSDASESAWMQYVYMEQVMPSNITGVTVQLSVTDANGNSYAIGTTTTDASGHFSFQYTPTITGKFSVTATFGGSLSYYGSYDTASFAIDKAAATTAPTSNSVVSNGVSNSDFFAAVAAIIVVIIIVGAASILLMRRKP